MRKELSHHTMSARARTAAGSRERGWSRAVPEVFCERPLPNKPVHSRTRTRSFGLSHGHCSVFPMISVLFRARMLERFQVCDRLSFVSPHFWLHLFTHKRIPASPEQRQHGDPVISRKTHNFFGLSLYVLSSKTHEFFGFSLSLP